MRTVLVGLFGLLVFCMLWPFVQFLVLGADRAGYYPRPTLATWYLRWLSVMAFTMIIAGIPTGLLMRALWRLMTR